MMDEIERKIAEAIERSYNDGYEDGLRDAKAECLKALAPIIKALGGCENG